MRIRNPEPADNDQETTARSEEQAALGQMNERRTLGTLADLLTASKRGRQ